MKEKLLSTFEVSLIVILIVIGGGLFYWYEYRPAKIRRECSETVNEAIKEAYKKDIKENIRVGGGIERVHEFIFKQCLREHGLKELKGGIK
jgi:hypothetical protein